jgi:hypothetical protein
MWNGASTCWPDQKEEWTGAQKEKKGRLKLETFVQVCYLINSVSIPFPIKESRPCLPLPPILKSIARRLF